MKKYLFYIRKIVCFILIMGVVFPAVRAERVLAEDASNNIVLGANNKAVSKPMQEPIMMEINKDTEVNFETPHGTYQDLSFTAPQDGIYKFLTYPIGYGWNIGDLSDDETYVDCVIYDGWNQQVTPMAEDWNIKTGEYKTLVFMNKGTTYTFRLVASEKQIASQFGSTINACIYAPEDIDHGVVTSLYETEKYPRVSAWCSIFRFIPDAEDSYRIINKDVNLYDKEKDELYQKIYFIGEDGSLNLMDEISGGAEVVEQLQSNVTYFILTGVKSQETNYYSSYAPSGNIYIQGSTDPSINELTDDPTDPVIEPDNNQENNEVNNTQINNLSGTSSVNQAADAEKQSAYKKAVAKAGTAKVSSPKVKAQKKKKAKVFWNAAAGASGYEIQYSLKKNFKKAKTVIVKGGSKQKATLKKLKAGKKYYVRIRPYTSVTNISGSVEKVYGKWSKTMKLKAKK